MSKQWIEDCKAINACKAEKLALLDSVMVSMEAMHQHWVEPESKLKDMVLDNLGFIIERLKSEIGDI